MKKSKQIKNKSAPALKPCTWNWNCVVRILKISKLKHYKFNSKWPLLFTD